MNEENRTVTGWAALSRDDNGQILIDHQNQITPISELEKAAHDLMRSGGRDAAGELHEKRIGDIVESMIFDASKRKALGLTGDGREGLAVTMHIKNDQAWEQVKKGNYPELSIHGWSNQTSVGENGGLPVYMLSNITLDEISLVDHGASGNDRVSPRIVLAKRLSIKGDTKMANVKEIKKSGLDSLVDLEALGLSDEQKAAVLAIIEAARGTPAPKADPQPQPKLPEEPKPGEQKPADMAKRDLELVELSKKFEVADGERQELSKQVRELKDERVLSEMIKRAEARPFIPMKSSEQAEILKRAKDSLGEDGFKKIDEMFLKVNEAMQKSEVFKQFGVDGEVTESAVEKLEKKVSEELANNAKAGIKLSKAQAEREVYKRNPQLYAEVSKESVGE